MWVISPIPGMLTPAEALGVVITVKSMAEQTPIPQGDELSEALKADGLVSKEQRELATAILDRIADMRRSGCSGKRYCGCIRVG